MTSRAYLTFSTCAMLQIHEITSELPLEIRCSIVKHVILNRVNRSTDYGHEVPAQIVSLIGYHPLLDNVMAMVLQELKVDEDMFSNIHFDQIAEFMLSKSISFKRMLFSDLDTVPTESHSNFIKLITGCQELKIYCHDPSIKPELERITFIEYATFISSPLDFLKTLRHSTNFRGFSRLLIMTVRIFIPMNQEMKFLKETLVEWKRYFESSCSREAVIRRSLQLSITITQGSDESDVCRILQSIKDLIILHRDSFHFSLSIYRLSSTEITSNMLVSLNSLIEQCDKYIEYSDWYMGRARKWMDTVICPKSIDMCFTDTLSYDQFCLGFKSMSPLKKLKLVGCKATDSLFAHLPETLESLHFELYDESTVTVVKLPCHLRVLSVETETIIPRISNKEQLTKLGDTSIHFALDGYSIDGYRWPFNEIFQTLQKFIYDLPCNVNRLRLTGVSKTHCFSELNSLSFNGFSKLEFLEIIATNSPLQFTYFSLPRLKHLELVSPSMCGPLPKTLEFLVIKFGLEPVMQFSKFWKKYISPLDNLLRLEACIEQQNIDFSMLDFPSHLASISISFDYENVNDPTTEVCLYEFPDSLGYLEICGNIGFNKYNFVAKGIKQADIHKVEALSSEKSNVWKICSLQVMLVGNWSLFL
ncbi:unnamed protein product [Ambrosiozyma monospora]|uniref:Unnamed protein product n=1 Tax=Ambrosiozyma monospora TaxID=43982 RepID=A0ACB5STM5_AMBMO|nr:unnamed protein product [Ambrosiozyma monospora]